MSNRRIQASDQQLRRLSVVHCPICELKANPRNPRQHTKGPIRQIEEDISTFSFNGPILTEKEYFVDGHARLLACHERGWAEVPTIYLDHLSPDQIRAYTISDNRLAETSDSQANPLGNVCHGDH